MMEHPIGEMMQSTMASIKDMVDVNTVVGDPVVAATGATIIPVSKVCFGYVTGGGDLPCEEKNKLHPPLESSAFPFAGGSGAGVSRAAGGLSSGLRRGGTHASRAAADGGGSYGGAASRRGGGHEAHFLQGWT